MVDYGHRLARDAPMRTTEGSRAIRRIAVIAAAAIAGAILGVAIAQMTIPSRAEMRQFAAALVPPDAALTDLAELSGPELLVGRYEAVAHFDTKGAPVDRISDLLLAHARAEGWTHVQTENLPGGDIQRWVRQDVAAAIYVRDLEGSDDGIVFVHYRFSPTDRAVIGLLLGGAIGVAVGYTVVMRALARTCYGTERRDVQ